MRKRRTLAKVACPSTTATIDSKESSTRTSSAASPSNVRTGGAYGDADVRLAWGATVVDTVAGQGNNMTAYSLDTLAPSWPTRTAQWHGLAAVFRRGRGP